MRLKEGEKNTQGGGREKGKMRDKNYRLNTMGIEGQEGEGEEMQSTKKRDREGRKGDRKR